MLLNTVEDLINYSRKELTDASSDVDEEFSIWTDEELIIYINNAQQEFSQYTKCIPDYSTYSITLQDGIKFYELDQNIIEVFGGYCNTTKQRVRVGSFRDIENGYILNNTGISVVGEWEQEVGYPSFLITDMHQSMVRVYPYPVSSTLDTITLYTYRLSNEVTSIYDLLEIPEQHRMGLIFRIMSLALSKRDTTEFNDPNISLSFSQKWESFKQDAKLFYDSRFNRKIEVTNASISRR